MIIKEKTLKTIYIVCALQFCCTFLYVRYFIENPSRIHMANVGLSAALGLLIASSARMQYHKQKNKEEQQEKYNQLEDDLKKIKDDERES